MLYEKKTLSICGICYIFGVIWFFLFPVVNITSGESKPRGMFVDEHALLTTSIPFEKVKHIANDPTIRNTSNMLFFLGLKGFGVDAKTIHNVGNIHSILIEPRFSPSGVELSVIVFKMCGDQYPQWTLDVIVSLLSHLRESRWMSKSVLALIVTDQFNSHSPSLEDWIRSYHNTQRPLPSHGSNKSKPSYYGLIRDALIIDLVSCISSASNHPFDSASTHRHTHMSTSPSIETHVTGFQGYEIAFTGSNGQLPNMDVISSLLSMQSRHITLRHHNNLFDILNTIKKALQPMLDNHVKHAEYVDRLMGLISFCYGQVVGQDGLHGHFLQYNVDSMTLKPLIKTSQSQASPKKRSSKGGMDHSTYKDNGLVEKLSISHLLSVIVSMIRVQSNLHEELHHSLFLYLVMDKWTFVGVAEYASCLLLVSVPLLICLWQLCVLISHSILCNQRATVKKNVLSEVSIKKSSVVHAVVSLNGIRDGVSAALGSAVGASALCLVIRALSVNEHTHTGVCYESIGDSNKSCLDSRFNSSHIVSNESYSKFDLLQILFDKVRWGMQYIARFTNGNILFAGMIVSIVVIVAVYVLASIVGFIAMYFARSTSQSQRYSTDDLLRGRVLGDITSTLFFAVLVICVGICTRNFALGFILIVLYAPLLVMLTFLTCQMFHSSTCNQSSLTTRIAVVVVAACSVIAFTPSFLLLLVSTGGFSDDGSVAFAGWRNLIGLLDVLADLTTAMKVFL